MRRRGIDVVNHVEVFFMHDLVLWCHLPILVKSLPTALLLVDIFPCCWCWCPAVPISRVYAGEAQTLRPLKLHSLERLPAGAADDCKDDESCRYCRSNHPSPHHGPSDFLSQSSKSFESHNRKPFNFFIFAFTDAKGLKVIDTDRVKAVFDPLVRFGR